MILEDQEREREVVQVQGETLKRQPHPTGNYGVNVDLVGTRTPKCVIESGGSRCKTFLSIRDQAADHQVIFT
jgi:microcompartment protein CcmK/EutM